MNVSTDRFQDAKNAMQDIVFAIVARGALPHDIAERAALIGTVYLAVSDCDVYRLVGPTDVHVMRTQHPLSLTAQPDGPGWTIGRLQAMADGFGSVPGVGPVYAARYAIEELVAVDDSLDPQFVEFMQGVAEGWLAARGIKKQAAN